MGLLETVESKIPQLHFEIRKGRKPLILKIFILIFFKVRINWYAVYRKVSFSKDHSEALIICSFLKKYHSYLHNVEQFLNNFLYYFQKT